MSTFDLYARVQETPGTPNLRRIFIDSFPTRQRAERGAKETRQVTIVDVVDPELHETVFPRHYIAAFEIYERD